MTSLPPNERGVSSATGTARVYCDRCQVDITHRAQFMWGEDKRWLCRDCVDFKIREREKHISELPPLVWWRSPSIWSLIITLLFLAGTQIWLWLR